VRKYHIVKVGYSYYVCLPPSLLERLFGTKEPNEETVTMEIVDVSKGEALIRLRAIKRR